VSAPPLSHPAPPPPAGRVALARDESLRLLADMVRVRRMEEKCAELYGAGKIRGFLHLYIGEEAVAAGAMRALEPQDNVVATYREHGHALLRGVPMRAIMAEMYGKREGCSHGRGGSMHLFDAKARFYGGNAIVAGGLPLAVGFALAASMRKISNVTACFFGEGAVAEGAFHESMNLAQLWRLPVAFLCENNLYAMGSDIDRTEAQTDLCLKAAGYGMTTLRVDGMDVAAVRDMSAKACSHVRAGNGPVFVEFRTYRYRPHSMFDPDLYRDKREIEQWKTRGPIHTFSARLKAQGELTEEGFLEIDRAAMKEVDDAAAFAEAGAWEPVEELARHVYTP
jgi:pyruvate dehydrogenase E1 component alpha subunit